MQKSARITEISTIVTGAATLHWTTLYFKYFYKGKGYDQFHFRLGGQKYIEY